MLIAQILDTILKIKDEAIKLRLVKKLFNNNISHFLFFLQKQR